MKFFVSLILIALLSFAACLYLPWWIIGLTSFIVVVIIGLRPGIAFLCGFLSLFLLWGGLSFWISNNNSHALAHKMSVLILNTDTPLLLILVTALLGGVVGGLGSLSGSLLRAIAVKKP